jgi:thymidylate kinase
MFVSFEGIDDELIAEQAALLSEHLQKLGYDSFVVEEPGETEVAKLAKHILALDVSDTCSFFIEQAQRAELVETVIAPRIQAGYWVIAKHFTDKDMVQAKLGYIDLDERTLGKIHAYATYNRLPGKTVVILSDVKKVAEKTGLKAHRLAESQDYLRERAFQGSSQKRFRLTNADKPNLPLQIQQALGVDQDTVNPVLRQGLRLWDVMEDVWNEMPDRYPRLPAEQEVAPRTLQRLLKDPTVHLKHAFKIPGPNPIPKLEAIFKVRAREFLAANHPIPQGKEPPQELRESMERVAKFFKSLMPQKGP